MKAPDKIYIQTNVGETLSSKWTTIPFRDFENTEYIRKEALLEWLENETEHPSFESCISEELDGYYAALENITDKINSL